VRDKDLLPDESERTLRSVHSYCTLAARCYPDAPFERLAAVCDYFSWLFFFDDVCENASLDGAEPWQVLDLLNGVYGVLEGRPPGTKLVHFGDALQDIWSRVAADSPPFWQRRFIRHVQNYIDGCVWEAHNRSANRVPSRAVFEVMRMYTSTMYEFWDFIEYAGGYFLPDDVVEQPMVAELRRAGNAIASFANDIYSLRKERNNRDIHNLVVVLSHEERTDVQGARNRAAAIHDAEVTHFFEVERHIPRFSPALDAQLAMYVSGIRAWIRANDDWSRSTPRYNELPLGKH
jgi:hypothetical protein